MQHRVIYVPYIYSLSRFISLLLALFIDVCGLSEICLCLRARALLNDELNTERDVLKAVYISNETGNTAVKGFFTKESVIIKSLSLRVNGVHATPQPIDFH